jgi:DNA-nicking Smr family endonuclease
MDFGDILDAWDKQTARAGKKQGGRPGPSAGGVETTAGPGIEEAKIDPVTAWLRVNGIYDKDSEDQDGRGKNQERRRRLRAKKPDAVLDLHGLNRDDAWAAMGVFFEESRRQEFEKVLLVHGKGNHSEGEAVLKRAVLQFIESCPFAGESGQPNAELGGSGATWVLLKETSKD